MVILPSPPMLQGNQTQQLQDVRRYLFRLVEQLQSSMNHLTADNFAAGGTQGGGMAGGGTLPGVLQTQDDLKSLIIKNADEVRQTINRITRTLESEYVAISDFGTFRETMENTITETAAGLEQQIITRSEIVDNYITTTNGYIRQGVVGYEGLTPIIGIAIGQDIRVTGAKEAVGGKEYEVIDTSQNMSVWTAEKLAFYVNGGEVAYFANDALYVTGIHTGAVTFPNWVIDDGNGLSFRWAGGGA